MEKEYGKEPDRLTFWEITHKKKTGEFVDSDTERKVNAARKELDGVVSQGIEPTSELIEELFTKHIGPSTMAVIPITTFGAAINQQVVDHGSANCSSPNIRSSNSSHEPQTILHGRTV
uniref:Uncharacterized protein n=1 Tax=Ananas comosus var. bracteatus TaxID=296719 RepID=A0A6V7PHQ2_ANACO|nr:unnamed protein product [Ananas comosus var. bracteatus]